MSMRHALGAAAAACTLAVLATWTTGPAARQLADDGVITGVVRSDDGPEAGVWVIAETDDLQTKLVSWFDRRRRALLLAPAPHAAYDLWIRGYGS